MIALFGRQLHSVFGLAALLDAEKIPYRRVERLADTAGDLLLSVDSELGADEIAALAKRPSLILNGGPQVARALFGATDARRRSAACSIGIDDNIWPVAVREIARGHGIAALRIPLAPICDATAIRHGTSLAGLTLAEPAAGVDAVGVAQREHVVWCSIDLGAAWTNLLGEAYLPAASQHRPAAHWQAWLRRIADGVYYLAPDVVRRRVRLATYRRLERRLSGLGACASLYPVDATGWLIAELLKALIKRAGGRLVRLDRWPAPYRAAATLTHDIEPRRYAYRRGLERLLDRADEIEPGTFGLVAAASRRHLRPRTAARLRRHAVVCHGMAHRGEPVCGRMQVAETLQRARTQLERQLGRPIGGYRSPRLDRSADLLWALDHHGFRFDSSFPDVDRENVRHFGGGVRLNVPFRPPIDDAGGVRASRCLELPLTAPDCIQPLMAGASTDELRAVVAAKAAFLRATGGLYVALVHGGVFGDRDAAVREEHLAFVRRQLYRRDVWFVGLEQIVDWWCAREALEVSEQDGVVRVRNTGTQPTASIRLLIEADTDTAVALPPLQPGAEATVAIPRQSATRSTRPLRWLRDRRRAARAS